MKLEIKNIGNVTQADIEINGITVIAGQNGTGKSTISRTLFAMFSSYFNLFDKIAEDRMKSVNRVLENYLLNIFYWTADSEIDSKVTRRIPRMAVRELQKKISDSISESWDVYGQLDEFSVTKIIDAAISEFTEKSSRFRINNLDSLDLRSISKTIVDLFNQSDSSIFNSLLTTNFKSEFNQQINNVFRPESGQVILTVKNQKYVVNVENNEVTTDSKLINFVTDVVYIDDAAANVDNLFYDKFGFLFGFDHKENHNSHLIKQLEINGDKETHTFRARVNDKLNNIFSNINSALGDVAVNSKQESEEDNKLNIVNYSSGMKTFYLIKKLLENGTISENGTLILDEPEVHLHPEWQLKFAEIIVMLQKEFGLHILLNSHSPYFVEAIDVYSKRNGINKNVKYYLASDIIEDVTCSIDRIYQQMYVPLNLLEELLEDTDD